MKNKLLIGLCGVGIIAGLVTAFRVYTVGFESYAKTDVLVWTLPIASYIFLSLTSAGLAFVSSIPTVFGIERYQPIKKRTVLLEVSVLFGAFVCLILHLGSPLNVFYFFFSPNPASPLWWLAILYGIYAAVLLVSFWKLSNNQDVKSLSFGVFFIAIATSTTLAWLLGMTDARPALNGPFMALYFPLTALACGFAVLLMFTPAKATFGNPQPMDRTPLLDEMAKLLGIIIGVSLVLFLWRTIMGAVSSSAVEYDAFRHMIGSISYNIELWIGLVVPFVLLMIPSVRSTAGGKVAATALVLFGMLAGRLEFILTAEVVPMGSLRELRPEIVSYMPHLWEVFVLLFGLSTVLLVYTLGQRFLKLDAVPE